MCNENKEQVQCMDCSERDNCEIYQRLEETLDKSNQYALVTMNFKFLINHKNIAKFLKDIHKPAAFEIAKHSSDLSTEVMDILDDFGTDTFSLCCDMDFRGISNEDAFNGIAEHIKDTHGENSNG